MRLENWQFILRNKYFITSTLFIIWVLFFDQNNLISQWQYGNQLDELNAEKAYYQKEIEKTRTELKELTSNPKSLEKFAREKYLMKRPNEEVFLFVEKSSD